MKTKKQLSILEFSRLTGINRDNLRFYDRIGLLSPEHRGDNRYRYYSRHQLNSAYLIISLRGMGVGIEEIKQFVANRTPEYTMELFKRQDELIKKKISQLHEVREIMNLHQEMMKEVYTHTDNIVYLEEKEKETIFLCPPIPEEMDEDEGGIFSYEHAEKHGINSGFPMGITYPFAKQDLNQVKDQYYFKVSRHGNTHKPNGQYVVIYGWVDPNHPMKIYQKLVDFITEHNLEVCGNIYEEYPLGDFSIKESPDYYARIEIPVIQKDMK